MGTKTKRPVYIYMMTIIGEAQLSNQFSQLSEDELVANAREGDAFAWTSIVQTHQEHIFRLAYLILKDPADAEDVAQETFIRAFTKLDDFDTDRPLRPWLSGIAINRARNRRRSIGRYVNQLQRLFKYEERKDAEKPEQAVGARWQADQLWSAVQRLSSNHQEVVYLRYFLEMSESDMVDTLKVPAGTIKSRLHRALSDLRQIVKNEFPELREHFE